VKEFSFVTLSEAMKFRFWDRFQPLAGFALHTNWMDPAEICRLLTKVLERWLSSLLRSCKGQRRRQQQNVMKERLKDEDKWDKIFMFLSWISF
jgi:hypothetical protein